MVGVATGLAEAGFVPFVYSIATFATLRPYEFIRNGPVLHRLPVRIVGVGGGLEYGLNGVTHYALEDIAVMRAQPGMTVLAPADFQQARSALIESRAVAGPVYFRLGKDETETVPGLDGRLRLGGVEQIGAGRDVASSPPARSRTRRRPRRRAPRGAGMARTSSWCGLPEPCSDPRRSRPPLRSVSLAVTVEAHYLSGGLGSLVSEVVAESGLGCRVVRCGVAGPPGVRRERGVPERSARSVGDGDRANRDRGARPT